MFHKIAMPLESAGPDGVITLTFPDNGAGTGFGALVEHLRLLGDMDPTQIAELTSGADGHILAGRAEITGADNLNLMERWSDVVEAIPRDLTDDEYSRMLRGVPLAEKEPRG